MQPLIAVAAVRLASPQLKVARFYRGDCGARRARLHLRNVIEEASRSASALGKPGSGLPAASSEMARTALEKSSADCSKQQTSTPALPLCSPSGGDGAAVVAEKLGFAARCGLLGYFLWPVNYDDANLTVTRRGQ